MDNKVFNVNGRSFYQFKKTIDLILTDEYEEEGVERRFGRGSGIEGFKVTPEKGMILYWYKNEDKGISDIEELVTEKIVEKYGFTKQLRKYKLEKIEHNKITVPKELLIVALWEWLEEYNRISNPLIKMELDGWDENLEHDGSNDKGFRIYVEDWGHIKNNDGITIDHYSSFAIKPIYCWYGK